jgi:hypothetical protein
MYCALNLKIVTTEHYLKFGQWTNTSRTFCTRIRGLGIILDTIENEYMKS